MAKKTEDDCGRARRYYTNIAEAFMRTARAGTSIPKVAAVAVVLVVSVTPATPTRADRGFRGGSHHGFHHPFFFHDHFFFHDRFFFGFNGFPFADRWPALVYYPGGYYAPPPPPYYYPPTAHYPPTPHYPAADDPPIAYNSPMAYNSPPPDAPAQDATLKDCHKFRQTISIETRPTKAYGTICRQPDGSWLVVP
jgi:hypothetical protein